MAWAVVVTILNFGLRAAIPGYHAAEATSAVHAGDEGRAADRGGDGIACRRHGGAGWIAPASKWAPWAIGLIILAMFLPVHVQLWSKFPVWYHLAFLVQHRAAGRARRGDSSRAGARAAAAAA